MTYYEITFFAMILPWFFFWSWLIGDWALGFICTILFIATSVTVSTIIRSTCGPILTAQVSFIPKVELLDDSGLLIVTDSGNTYTYTDYSTIQKWQKGHKFTKNYYFININFGPNLQFWKVEII